MRETLLRGLKLRCPNCGEGHISDGLFSIKATCEVCGVRFERKSGESAGASIIWLSILPIPALILYFVMVAINPDLPLAVQLAIPLGFLLVMSLIGYRHIRGLWIAVVALTDGLHADDDEDR
ncbi:MAG: DUF983 domain-containing protein [Aggregatilineales bacterium]